MRSTAAEIIITARNYRCFSMRRPLTIRLAPGIIALVGPNNAGKSTAMRLLRELRDVLRVVCLGDATLMPVGARATTLGVSLYDVGDDESFFCDRNDHEAEVSFELPDPAPDEISAVRLRIGRQPVHAVVQYCLGPKRLPVDRLDLVGDRTAQAFDSNGQMQLARMDAVCSALRAAANSCYVGSHRSVGRASDGNLYDAPVGRTFVANWSAWKNGGGKRSARAINALTEALRKMFGLSSLEINPSDDRSELMLVVDKRTYTLREVGVGFAQAVCILGSLAMKEADWALIDEPEQGLHPRLQADLIQAILASVSTGVMFTTHSLALARCTADTTYAMHRTPDDEVVAELLKPAQLGVPYLREMILAGGADHGFQAVLAVEGTSDIPVFRELLRRLRVEGRVLVLPLGGGSLISARGGVELSEWTRLRVPTAVVIDSERDRPDAELAPDREAFLAACSGHGFAAYATKFRAIENYFTPRAIESVHPEQRSGIQPYEALMPGWRKRDNVSMARMMSDEEWAATDVYKFLSGWVADAMMAA
jgi:ABC-type cobalamin/Fe3+-siderophores transport system ATPase subunit